MLKVFGRKKSSTPAPSKPVSISSPKAPAPAVASRSRTQLSGDVTPLHAKFATRGESLDRLPAQPTPAVAPPTEDTRAEYMKSVTSANRVYGNASVTRFGSGAALPDGSSPTGSRRDLNSGNDDEVPVAARKTSNTARLVQSATAPSVPIGGRRQRQSTSEGVMLPPRAPALFTKQSSSSVHSRDGSYSDASSITSNQRPQLSKTSTPSEFPKAYPNSVQPNSPTTSFSPNNETPRKLSTSGASIASVDKILPPPPPTTLPLPSSTPPVRTESPTSITTTLPSTPKASSLVHPAFKRPPISLTTSPTPSASSLMHPSQRLRTPSSTISVNTPSTKPTHQVLAPVAPPIDTISSKSSSVPDQDTEAGAQSSAYIELPSNTETSPPSPTPSATKPTPPSASEAPPSSFSEFLPEVVKKARRKSQEFGTYDIGAARRVRESLMAGTTSGNDLSNSTTVSSDTTLQERSVSAIRTPAVTAYRDANGILRLRSADPPQSRPLPIPPVSPEPSPTRRQRFSNIGLGNVSSDVNDTSPDQTSSPSTPRGKPEKAMLRDAIGSSSNRGGRHFSLEAMANLPSHIQSSSKGSRPLPPPRSTGNTANPSMDGMALPRSQSVSQSSSYSSNQSSGVFSAITTSTQHTAASYAQNDTIRGQDPHTEHEEQPQLVTDQTSVHGAIETQEANVESSSSPVAEPANIRKKRMLPSVQTRQHLLQLPTTPSTHDAPVRRRSSRAVVVPITPPPPHQQKLYDPDVSGPLRRREERIPLSDLPLLASGAVSNRVAQLQAALQHGDPGDQRLSMASTQSIETVSPIPTFYPLTRHLEHPQLIAALLQWMTFRDFLPIFSLTAESRRIMETRMDIKETILERYLTESVGYRRWSMERMGSSPEPLSLTLRDLNSYIRGVSLPLHHYTNVADAFLTALAVSTTTAPNMPRTPVPKILTNQVRMMASSTRAYTKVVLRLRAQAEAEAVTMPAISVSGPDFDSRGRRGARGKDKMPATGPGTHPPTSTAAKLHSRRAPSPAFSFASASDRYGSPGDSSAAAVSTPGRFRSPLYKSGHAALLRVFVPSPEGAWLSDSSVIECERELKRAGAVGLLRVGDVVHDLAAGDEANTGRLVWDGNYLIDLDYSYNPIGEIPRHIDSLAYPPAYFHKIVRNSGNPIVYIDLRPFAVDIADHLSLLQDRIQTDTPQGSFHTVVRWIHRARFSIRPNTPVYPFQSSRTPPDRTVSTQMVDPGWYGTIVIEAEGTNEGLADLQARVGNAVKLFAMKALISQRVSSESLRVGHGQPPRHPVGEGGKSAFRLLRAQSRPGEIWLRCVRDKERIA
ncbi:hypothetical protein FRB95_002925 [Tulasnella sp. JGI-2019a]|nr:hypothetical protein FRB95_002925 [Tulasnella sp. JGI-2019a]